MEKEKKKSKLKIIIPISVAIVVIVVVVLIIINNNKLTQEEQFAVNALLEIAHSDRYKATLTNIHII